MMVGWSILRKTFLAQCSVKRLLEVTSTVSESIIIILNFLLSNDRNMATRAYGTFYGRVRASYFDVQFEIYRASLMIMRTKVHLPLSE